MKRYKLSTCKKDSTRWETQWFNTEQEAKMFASVILSDDPNHKVIIKAWEFEEHETTECTKTLSVKGVMEPRHKINFEILKNQSGSFIVCIEGTHTLGETYDSEEDALAAIENYMRTPFIMTGMPCNA